jgi:hypothetical protein
LKVANALALAALATLSFALPSYAAGFESIVLSAEKDAASSQSNFPADTPVINIGADLVDVPATSKVTFAWFSVVSPGAAPPNFAIATVDIPVGSNTHVSGQLSKPNAGWPVGTYKVDLEIDGKVVESVPFSIP